MSSHNKRPFGKFKGYIDKEKRICLVEVTDPTLIVYLLKLQSQGKLPAKMKDHDFGENDI